MWQGAGSRVDPFQRMTELESPDALDSLCSVYSAYRSLVYQVTKAGTTTNLDSFMGCFASSSMPFLFLVLGT